LALAAAAFAQDGAIVGTVRDTLTKAPRFGTQNALGESLSVTGSA